MERVDLGEALAQAALHIGTRSSLEETLDAVVTVARDTMPGIDHVGVTLVHRDGSLETAAASDEFVMELDRLQYELGEGPCLSALADPARPVVVVEDARHSGEWRRFIPEAARRGLRAQLGVRLFVADVTFGALNLYSTSTDFLPDGTRQMAELFATHAALAYGHKRQLDHMQQALATRESIGRAVGIVMERYQLSSDRAFEYLVRVSSSSQTKLRDVAEELVRSTESAHVARQHEEA